MNAARKGNDLGLRVWDKTRQAANAVKRGAQASGGAVKTGGAFLRGFVTGLRGRAI